MLYSPLSAKYMIIILVREARDKKRDAPLKSLLFGYIKNDYGIDVNNVESDRNIFEKAAGQLIQEKVLIPDKEMSSFKGYYVLSKIGEIVYQGIKGKGIKELFKFSQGRLKVVDQNVAQLYVLDEVYQSGEDIYPYDYLNDELLDETTLKNAIDDLKDEGYLEIKYAEYGTCQLHLTIFGKQYIEEWLTKTNDQTTESIDVTDEEIRLFILKSIQDDEIVSFPYHYEGISEDRIRKNINYLEEIDCLEKKSGGTSEFALLRLTYRGLRRIENQNKKDMEALNKVYEAAHSLNEKLSALMDNFNMFINKNQGFERFRTITFLHKDALECYSTIEKDLFNRKEIKSQLGANEITKNTIPDLLNKMFDIVKTRDDRKNRIDKVTSSYSNVMRVLTTYKAELKRLGCGIDEDSPSDMVIGHKDKMAESKIREEYDNLNRNKINWTKRGVIVAVIGIVVTTIIGLVQIFKDKGDNVASTVSSLESSMIQGNHNTVQQKNITNINIADNLIDGTGATGKKHTKSKEKPIIDGDMFERLYRVKNNGVFEKHEKEYKKALAGNIKSSGAGLQSLAKLFSDQISELGEIRLSSMMGLIDKERYITKDDQDKLIMDITRFLNHMQGMKKAKLNEVVRSSPLKSKSIEESVQNKFISHGNELRNFFTDKLIVEIEMHNRRIEK